MHIPTENKEVYESRRKLREKAFSQRLTYFKEEEDFLVEDLWEKMELRILAFLDKNQVRRC